MSGPPNFHVSYEKLKKISEELRGGGDKDASYWAWRNEASDSSSEDEFKQWITQKRKNNQSLSNTNRSSSNKTRSVENEQRNSYRRDRNRGDSRERVTEDRSRDKTEEDRGDSRTENKPRHPTKRKQKGGKGKGARNTSPNTRDGARPALWDPGKWKDGARPAHCYYSNKPSRTAKGGGVIKLPGKIKPPDEGMRHSPIGVVRSNTAQRAGPQDFIYSDSASDSDGYFNEDYVTSPAVVTQLSNVVAMLNVVGIEKRSEKCSVEASQCSSTFCKEMCSKFLGDGSRKRNSLEVLTECFEEHHTEIIHLRQELACVTSCAMMYDLEVCQDLQAEAYLWKNVFYLLIQYYRNSMASTNSESVKSTLSQQLEGHISEGISFYLMLVKQIQKRYQVNYKHHTTGHNRSQVLALLLLHKIFLWIGDLYRYLSQARDTEEWGQARNYYMLAQTLAPRNPRPYHQLALLGKYAHRRLHAVFYFTLSLLVRNPFTQSKELLLAVLAEIRQKALLLQERDEERSKRSKVLPGSKEVYSNKVIEWVFESPGDQSLSIPPPDVRKRFVVYLLSCLGGLLSRIDIDRVEQEFHHFHKFYQHYINLVSFESDEVYVQLLVVQLYTLHNTPPDASPRTIAILEAFLKPALNVTFVSNAAGEDDWLRRAHSPLSLIFLLSQSQSVSTELVEQCSRDFKVMLVTWLNRLKAAIQPYKKYTDFTEESVVLQEVTMLRGIELLSSLQSITKPFYLGSLTRGQSEDLGRAVLIVSTFEKLASALTFLEYDKDSNFVFVETSQDDQTSSAQPSSTQPVQPSSTQPVQPSSTQPVQPSSTQPVQPSSTQPVQPSSTQPSQPISTQPVQPSSTQHDQSDSGSDIEVISEMTITNKTEDVNVEDVNVEEGEEKEEEEEEDHEMEQLKEKREKLRITLQEKQDRQQEVAAAVKELQGMRVLITVKPKYVVPDTNCFMDYIDKIQRLIVGPYKVLIPLVVVDEITGLCKNEEKGHKALLALDVVQKHIADKSVSLITSKGSILDSTDFSEGRTRLCNDDLILNGVLGLSDATGTVEEMRGTRSITRHVVFLTDDNNLRVKAHSHNLAVQTIPGFMKCAKL